jgi:hypothetical protein
VPPNLEQLAGPGVDRRWKKLTIEQQRDVVRLLLDVTVLPSKRPRGSTGFAPTPCASNGAPDLGDNESRGAARIQRPVSKAPSDPVRESAAPVVSCGFGL